VRAQRAERNNAKVRPHFEVNWPHRCRLVYYCSDGGQARLGQARGRQNSESWPTSYSDRDSARRDSCVGNPPVIHMLRIKQIYL